MAEPEIYAVLGDVFGEVFLRDDIALSPALSAKDVQGWDSFKHIELLLAVELRFGIKFRSRDLDCLHNVGDLVQLIATEVRG
jgi:acyl carrier protein